MDPVGKKIIAHEVGLEAFVKVNEQYLRDNPDVPLIRDSGISIDDSPAEVYRTAGEVLRDKRGGHEDVACWRAAEIRVREERDAHVGIRGVPGRSLHVVVVTDAEDEEHPEDIVRAASNEPKLLDSKRAEIKSIMDKLFPPGWEEMFVRRQVMKFKRSWAEQPTEVRKLRMRYVLQMAAELAEIRKTTGFSTAFCEWAIEAVITGDPDDLRLAMDMISEKGFEENAGDELGARYAPLFAKFRDICEEARVVLGDAPKGKA